MKAIVQDKYGSPEVLELRDIDKPAIGDDEVLVRIRAASANPADWAIMSGLPYIARPVYGLRKPKNAVRGTDVAGTVEAVGAGVTRLRPGAGGAGWGGGRGGGGAGGGGAAWAGAVEPAGAGVTRLRRGEEVFGWCGGLGGAFAEYAAASEDALAPKPDSLTFEQAAARPMAGPGRPGGT